MSYKYDCAGTTGIANSKGRLTLVSSSVSSYSYDNFDTMGRVLHCTQTTNGQAYTLSYGYDLAGNMISETYPSGRAVQTEYDSAGRIAGVKNQATGFYWAGATASDTVNRIQYAAHGAVSTMKLGNGKWEHTNFNGRLQPTVIGLGTSSADSSILRLDYTYGTTTNNGNVQSQTITAPGLTLNQCYGYDRLNRLSTAEERSGSTVCAGTQQWKQAFSYDRCGNRNFDVVNTTGNVLGPNPTISQTDNRFAALQNYGYDNAGNLTSDPSTPVNGIVYDAENRQTQYTKTGQATNSYFYDGDGHRVKKIDSSGTTIFVYNAGGQLIAEYHSDPVPSPAGGGGTSYLTTDHLGSTRVVTRADGGVKARYDYLPFGEDMNATIGGRTVGMGYSAADSTKQKFTQKERDNESGLDYFGARYYSSAQGRFTGVDNPRYAKATDPQTWNLYAYVRNGPLNKIDPDGRNWFRIGDHYEWHEGNKYTYKDDKDKTHTVRSNFTHLLVFERTGTNSQGAVTGTLKLYEQNKVIATANAFSGGNRNVDIPPGNFMIRLDIRGKADSLEAVKPNGRELKQFYGIQEIAPTIPGSGNHRWEWGSVRAALNEEPGETRPEYQGNYLHGKQRPGDYTHGCICNRDEHILNILLGLDYKQVPKVPVVVR